MQNRRSVISSLTMDVMFQSILNEKSQRVACEKTETETIYMNIEKGTDENEMITISEKGNVKDGISSDIKVKILLEKHRDYTVEALILYYTSQLHSKKVCVDLNLIWNILMGEVSNLRVLAERYYKMEMKR